MKRKTRQGQALSWLRDTVKNATPDECCLWPFDTSPKSKHRDLEYGRVRFREKTRQAHRVSWEIANDGPPPNGMFVLHSCDNSLCVNPHHLRVGTHADNMADRTARGRNRPPHGEKCGASKISERSVLEIRRRYAAGGVSQSKLGAEYGISQSGISVIVTRRAWARV